MRQGVEIDVDIQVVLGRRDSMRTIATITEASYGWWRARRRRGRSVRWIGYEQPIAAAAVLGQLHSALVRSHP